MILERVKAILSEQFDVEETAISVDTNLTEDLEADSLDLADLLETLEDEFDTEVTDDIIGSINTVGDIVNYIAEAKNLS